MPATIYFFNGDNPEIEAHYYEKEYRDDIVVEIDNTFYEVYFFTRASLVREMLHGSYFSMPGLIILEEMKKEAIIGSLKFLLNIGFFDPFKGYTRSTILTSKFWDRLYVKKSNPYSFECAGVASITID